MKLIQSVCYKVTAHNYRALLYPFLIKQGKPTPLHLFLLAFIFCSVNGYIQGSWHTRHHSNVVGFDSLSIIGMYSDFEVHQNFNLFKRRVRRRCGTLGKQLKQYFKKLYLPQLRLIFETFENFGAFGTARELIFENALSGNLWNCWNSKPVIFSFQASAFLHLGCI